MRCSQCGAELAEGETFCRVCGARVSAPVPQPEQPKQPEPNEPSEPAVETEKKPKKKPDKPEKKPKEQPARKPEKPRKSARRAKFVAIIALAIVLVTAVAVLVWKFAFTDDANIYARDAKRPFAVESGGELLLCGDGTLLARTDGEWAYDESAWNGTSALVCEDGRLVVATSDGAEEAASLVATARVSADGSRVAYLKNYDAGAKLGDLYVYNVEKKTTAAIDTGVREGFVLSPSGAAICYSAYDQASDADHLRLSKNQKKGERLLDCEEVYALSDDAQTIFFANGGKLYCSTGGSRVKVCELSELDPALGLMFSADCTQMLYEYSARQNPRVFSGGAESEIEWVGRLKSEPLAVAGEGGASAAKVLRVKDFFETIYHGDARVVGKLLDGDFAIPTDKSEDYLEVVVSADERKLAAIGAGGSVEIYALGGEGGASLDGSYKPESRPTALYADEKLSSVYFTNEKGELWQISKGRQNMVSADASDVCMGGDGALYFVYDGAVLCRASGAERVSIERNTVIESIAAAPSGAVVSTASGCAYYRAGEKVEWASASASPENTTAEPSGAGD